MAATEEVFQVIVRFRPLNAREIQAIRDYKQEDDRYDEYNDYYDAANNNGNGNSNSHVDSLLNICSDTTFTFDEKAYSFDRVFDHTVNQHQLYDRMIRPLVERFVREDHDMTIIAYGQTSSGKTHTIDGSVGTMEAGMTLPDSAGLLPRTICDIFRLTAEPSNTTRYTVEFSFYEIYCEKIVDLLAATTTTHCTQTADIQLFDDRQTGKVFMKNLTWERCVDAVQLIKRLNETRANRHYAFTEMNSNSSRSHTIFDLRLTACDRRKPMFKNCRIVDLAGSERASRTKAVGVTFEEGKKINQSLMDLRSIISQLSRGSGGGGGGNIVNHRASKLTRILYGSFRGQSRVVILICCSPALDSRSETAGSLRFGCHAKKISLKLDEVKQHSAANAKQTRAQKEAMEMSDRLNRMAAEAQLREQKISSYETEMESLRVLIRSLEEKQHRESEDEMTASNDSGMLSSSMVSLSGSMSSAASVACSSDTAIQVDLPHPLKSAAAPLIADNSPNERYLVLLERERRRNLRYRETIAQLRQALDDKIQDNEQLEHELHAMRTLKNLLLREL